MAPLTRRALGLVALVATAIVTTSARQPPSGHSPLEVATVLSVAPRSDAPRADASPALVVLAHGMGRTSRSMRPLARALEAEGYDVLNFGYSSYCCSIPELGDQLRRAVETRVGSQHTAVHFVGHSLGNIIIRWTLTHGAEIPNVGRVVMLAPPNQGARAANRMAPVAGWLLKPIGELRGDSVGIVRTLPPMSAAEVGVIAARGDHTVMLPETHLAEERDHIVVGGGHSFIMFRDDVQQHTLAFLRTGSFALDGRDYGRSGTKSP